MTLEDDIAELLESPCIGVCEIDPVSHFCRGCGRRISEIAAWRSLDLRQRQDILAQLPQRLPLTRSRRSGRSGRLRKRAQVKT